MAIQNGQMADADEVMGAFSLVSKNLYETIINNTASSNLLRFKIDKFDSDTMNITGNISYNSDDDWYWGVTDVEEDEYTSFDEFDDESINTSKWQTGGTAENGGSHSETESSDELHLDASWTNSSGSSASSYVISKDIYDSGGFIMIYAPLMEHSQDTSYPSGSAWIYLGDNLIVNTGSKTTWNDVYVQIVYFQTVAYVRYKHDSGSYTSWTRYTINPTDQIKIGGNGSAGSDVKEGYINVDVEWVRYNSLETAMSGDNYITSNLLETSTSTITNAILFSNYYENEGSNIVFQLSADNGSNWENVTPNQIHRFLNTGTQLKARMIFKGAVVVKDYGVIYNLY